MEYFGNILYDEKLKDSSSDFVIYGAGRFGNKLYEFMELNGMRDQILCFCDKNPAFKGTTCRGLPVISPDNLKENDQVHVLFGGVYAYEILEYLVDHHINKIHFLYF